ncbi:MAG: hypothetical protein DME04_05265 [Candidatus Rokuibacteriota bacterium]|nr:MAG: hypothetical protein DME04_05265 [Candidatus Rokubacteria bacterium]
MTVRLLALVLLLAPLPAAAEIVLPPGFSTQVYVTGEGFDTDSTRGARGIPSTSTIAFDAAGALYLARTGRRYGGGEAYDLWPIYRFPPGGARVTPHTEKRYLHGPPLLNAQVAGTRGGKEILVTTFDRERRIGALYRMADGRAELLAGGTPPRGIPALLHQPEGAAVDTAGNVYVTDRAQNIVVRLDGDGRVLDRRYLSVTRPRLLATDDKGHVWVASDGAAEAPFQQGPGEIVRIDPTGASSVVLRGSVVAAIGASPGGDLFIADRHERQVFVLAQDGRRVPFASFTDNDTPRSLGFAPITPETQRAGVAGDLFIVTIKAGTWIVNEVIRVSGPFDELIRGR